MTDETLKVINEILPSGRIIDFGAGTGRLAIPLTQNGYDVVAIEQSKSMTEVIKRKTSELNLEISIHNASITDYGNGKANLALCLFTVLSYATTENELTEIIHSVGKNLNSNGYFFFDLPNRVFFDANRLIDINTDDFKRVVRLTEQGNENIYIYTENCSGNMNGVEFNYTDNFSIRYWECEFLDKLAKKEGFVQIAKDFSQFNYTGSTYKLYQKNENI